MDPRSKRRMLLLLVVTLPIVGYLQLWDLQDHEPRVFVLQYAEHSLPHPALTPSLAVRLHEGTGAELG